MTTRRMEWFIITALKISETGGIDLRIVKSQEYIQQYPDYDEEEWDYE